MVVIGADPDPSTIGDGDGHVVGVGVGGRPSGPKICEEDSLTQKIVKFLTVVK